MAQPAVSTLPQFTCASSFHSKMSNTRFSTDEIPDLQGKVVIVTGGNVVSKASRRRLCDSNERTTKANPAERPPLPPPILSSNQGIGLETVKQLALKHAKVYLW